MLAKAAVLCGKNTIQVRELELPPIGDDELLVKNISNSICLSTYKAALLGEDHKRVPDNISERPPITGHEFTGIIMEVGNHLKDRFQPGEKFVLQPAMGLPSGYSAGYSYEYFGGNATYCIIPKIAIDLGCVLPYQGNYFANASLSEPMSCIIGAYHATYHTKQYVYEHFMGVKEQGKLALMGCAGPMGIGAIDYAVNGPVSSKLIVVTDIDEQRLERARTLIPEEAAKKQGKTLIYINTKDIDAVSELHIRVHPMNNILSIRASKWNGWLILVIWVLFYSGNVLKLNQEASTILLGAYLVCKVHAIACGAMCIMGLLVLLRKRAFVLLLMIAVFVPYVQDVIAVIGIADILFLLRDKMKRGVINGSFGKF